ncbi:DNA ligase [Paenibacillus anaericanus]|uniref:DNA ligase (ATP) n=1 Tax=Paenibacillus anaericanus TaxID=170367 RepID=A0A433YA08_9BACL|nr:RNA ligase family protein [Paenibacillus anaericanus]RUT46714.1 DNA ligase [Paenibacillus anaericanus]
MELKPVTPFEPLRTEVIPSGSNWVAQVKWDGVRILTYYDGHETRLINRKGNERSRQYPEFIDVPSYCQAHSVILDGEMIALAGGKPSFHEIMKRDSLRREQEISFAVGRTLAIYMIFDILYYNGQWVTNETLEHRQQLLQNIITPHSALQLVPNVQDGEALFTVMKERGWEGMVCKRLDSSYLIGGKDSRWQKLKLGYDLYAVIGGVTYRDGIVNALLLGLYNQEGNFIYIGHAGGGKLKVADLRELTEIIQTMIRETAPFVNQPQRVKGAIWVQPTLSVKVQFMEWTPGGTMRHPVIQGMATVPPEMCVVTQIE